MTISLTFAPQAYSGGRILLMMGQHQIGAVFPPSTDARIPQIWRWGFWLGSNGTCWTAGHAKTELAAKNAILSKGREWLQQAGVLE
jgi:hypothetical protein